MSFESWGLIVDYFNVECWYLCIMLPLRWSWPPLWLLWHTFLAGPVWGMFWPLFFTCLFMCCTCLYMSVPHCCHYCWHYFSCQKDIYMTLLLPHRYVYHKKVIKKKYIFYHCCQKISIWVHVCILCTKIVIILRKLR